MLNNVTPMGRLQRMTTWKVCGNTKTSLTSVSNRYQIFLVGGRRIRGGSKAGPARIPSIASRRYNAVQVSCNHLTVLTGRSTVIPVGEDQAQHLELAKYIADAFNRAYGEIFPIPEPLIGKCLAQTIC